MFFRALPGMIGPRTSISERVEGRVKGDQPDDLIAGSVVEFLEGNLTDDPVAEIAPRPGRRGHHHNSQGQCEADKMTKQFRMARGTILPIRVRSSQGRGDSSPDCRRRSIR